jgi:serine/threonine-protein kinase
MGEPVIQLGRYALHAEIAAGGMATVYLGRLHGAVGFGRTVAIKRLHPHLAKDPEFVSMFLDEAHLAARVQHPNVVPTLDVVTSDGELFLVLEYVRGESFSALVRAARAAGETLPITVVVAVVVGMLNGLHAAHEATDEQGKPLGIVHRDVSPQNVLVGADGIARVLDFGVAKAATRLQTTREGQLKGKVSYMAPEQLNGEVTRRTDIYAAGVVLWEALTGKRLMKGDTEAQLLNAVLSMEIPPPSSRNPEVSAELDAVVMKAVAKKPEDRFATAADMAMALEHAVRPASTREVSAWMEQHLGESLNRRRRIVAEIESSTSAPGRGELLKMIDASGEPLSGPLPPSVRSLPDLPLPDASGPNAQPSTASLTLSRHPPPPKARLWLAGLLLLPVLAGGVALGIALSRPVTRPAFRAASTDVPVASAVVPPPASAIPSASASSHPSATASTKPTIRKPTPSAKPTTTSPSDDLDKLIQTGH